MSEKFAMILGAGLLQRPAFEAAKSFGMKILAADANERAICVPMADIFCHIDLKDDEALADFAADFQKTHDLAAVFTCGTDFSFAVSTIAERCGLFAHSASSAKNACDKILMRKCFEKAGIPSPKHREWPKNAASESSAADFCRDAGLAFPLVVKPVDNMGARGCRKVESAADLASACKIAAAASRTGRVIVEEFMDGPEFSLDALFFGGTMIVTGFADRHIYFPPYFVELGHTMPSDAPANVVDAVCRAFKAGCEALGLSRGACKGDMKMTSNGPAVGEIAARLSGGYMSGWTFPYASGLDLVSAAFEIACGREPSLFSQKSLAKMRKIDDGLFIFPCNRTSAERAFISIPGVAKSILGVDGAERGTKDFFPRFKTGDVLRFPQNNVEKGGNVITAEATRNAAVENAENAVASIVVELESPNAATEAFLQNDAEFPPKAFDFPADVSAAISAIDGECKVDLSKPLRLQMPKCLDKCLKIRDWNCKTLELSIVQVEKYAPKIALPARTFWLALQKGGVQAAIYAAAKFLPC